MTEYHHAEKISPSAENITVLCDPKRISQMICNLVTNSVDFVPDKGGKITLNADFNGGESLGLNHSVVFSVTDNGPGIPRDKVANLFKKFYQIDTSLTRKHGGTGLGLAISKGIVEAHGGKIWIDLDYSDGTCIKFNLPVESSDVQGQGEGKSKMYNNHNRMTLDK
jgi:signal transduction histidine kinase